MTDLREWSRVRQRLINLIGLIGGAAESPDPLEARQYLDGAKTLAGEALDIADPMARERLEEFRAFDAWTTAQEQHALAEVA